MGSGGAGLRLLLATSGGQALTQFPSLSSCAFVTYEKMESADQAIAEVMTPGMQLALVGGRVGRNGDRSCSWFWGALGLV